MLQMFFFELYLLEINQRPEIMDPNQQNWLSIILLREKKGKDGN